MRKRLNGVLSSRAFYVAFSIVAAIALWIYVEYEVNPDVPNYVSGIPIEFINSELVTDRNLIITDISAERVALTFVGRRNAVLQLNNSNVKLTVDLAQITGPGRSMLVYSEEYPEAVNSKDFYVSERSEDYIALVVENRREKSFFVKGGYTGNIAMEGYQAGPLEFSPDMITVYGPEALLSKVDRAYVAVPRENLTSTVVEEYPFALLDKDGNEIADEALTFSAESVTVTISIKKVSEIPLKVNLVYGAGADEENTVCTVNPPNITLAGEADDMQLNYILLGAIDLTGFEASLTESFPIIIPDGLANLTGITDATVTVRITGLETRRISTSNIQVVNVTEGYVGIPVTQNVEVVVRGAPEEIRKLTPSNVRVVADLAEFGNTSGTHSVSARVYVDGEFDRIGAIGEYAVAVALSEDEARFSPQGGAGGSGR
jgi:YbbR domain-containing protein